MNADFLELQNVLGKEEMRLLHFFARDTTERILYNISRLNIRSSGALERSIHAVVYNNARGNDAFISFYYMNYAVYLEYALGSYYKVDDDLTRNGKRHGVRYRNVKPVPAISGTNFSPISTDVRNIKGINERRGEKHRAKPIIGSEIRLHLKSTQKRLAMLLGFTATAYLTKDIVSLFSGIQSASDRAFAESGKIYAEKYDTSDRMFNAIHEAQKAWLQARGYLVNMDDEFGLSAFTKESLNKQL